MGGGGKEILNNVYTKNCEKFVKKSQFLIDIFLSFIIVIITILYTNILQ